MMAETASPNRRHKLLKGAAIIGLLLLVIVPRFTALNQYLIVDEADRWRWAKNFTEALSRGDLAGTLVGDGYPGIVPVWAETIWLGLEAGRRSLAAGQWIGQDGLYLLFHQWDRIEYLARQRFPIVLLNSLLALAVIGAVWRLFGRRAALVGGLLIALDPFYLSDSRVNRAEAIITGLMTLSILMMIFYHRKGQLRYVALSGLFGGLSFLTKIQALVICPAIGLIGLLIHLRPGNYRSGKQPPLRGGSEPVLSSTGRGWADHLRETVWPLLRVGLIWVGVAGLVWLILWPAMWVRPLETLSLVYSYTTRKVGAEGVNLFFWGQTYRDADPGPLFYPVVLLMRLTPLVLLGLIGAAVGWLRERRQRQRQAGSLILVIYILTYALIMTFGSHKQDRYLMPIFLGLDILAGLGWVYLTGRLNRRLFALFWAGLLAVQLVTIWPHHPYYYSYFNPLLGDGPVAMRTLRIGWGEGMDQVGAYLAAKPNSRELTVSSRFTHNMLGFKGELISLLPDGRWTGADYIVLYIQQVQRHREPSPGFIDYFLQRREAEKIITIGGITYAWIYPIPFANPADPQASRLPKQAALLGYSWEPSLLNHDHIRLWWENLGLNPHRQIVAALFDESENMTGWAACHPEPAFTVEPGVYVESLCALPTDELEPGLYTVRFGLASEGSETVTPFPFAQGRHATRLDANGQVGDSSERERLEAALTARLPAAAHRVDRLYGERLRLTAYQLEPSIPQPGDWLTATLYWQAVAEIPAPLRLTVQLADSRSLSLGRRDKTFHAETLLPGQVITTAHQFQLPAELDGPLAARLEVRLVDPASETPLPAVTFGGDPAGERVGRFTIAPPTWPDPAGPVRAAWQGGIRLVDYTLDVEGEQWQVRLFWQAERPITDSYIVFVHALDGTDQIVAQNDSLPRAGAYPTEWWLPGQTVEDSHPLPRPEEATRLAIGLYRPEDGARLPLLSGEDSHYIDIPQ